MQEVCCVPHRGFCFGSFLRPVCTWFHRDTCLFHSLVGVCNPHICARTARPLEQRSHWLVVCCADLAHWVCMYLAVALSLGIDAL